MGLLNCYTDYSRELCEKDIYEYELYGYQPKSIPLQVWIPPHCRTIEMFRKLKDYYGIQYLMLPVVTEDLWNARKARWSPDRIVIWAGSDISKSTLDQFDLDRHGVWQDSKYHATPFKGIYFDEPSKDQREHICEIYRYIIIKGYADEVIVGDYSHYVSLVIIPGPLYSEDYWRWWYYNNCADTVMYNSPRSRDDLSSDQRTAWSLIHRLLGDGAYYWIYLEQDYSEFNDLLEKAKNLKAGRIWIFGSSYSMSCDEFEKRLSKLCEVATIKGIIQRGDRRKYVTTVFCQRSDCRECIDVPTDNQKYWGPKPLPVCPPRKGGDISPTSIFVKPLNKIWLISIIVILINTVSVYSQRINSIHKADTDLYRLLYQTNSYSSNCNEMDSLSIVRYPFHFARIEYNRLLPQYGFQNINKKTDSSGLSFGNKTQILRGALFGGLSGASACLVYALVNGTIRDAKQPTIAAINAFGFGFFPGALIGLALTWIDL